MIITKYTAIVMIACSELARAFIRESEKYNVLQDKTDNVKLDPYSFRYWPQDSAGLQNIDSICPKGYTCLPNYISPPSRKRNLRNDTVEPIKNKRFRGMAYSPVTSPGGGCLGLEEYDQVALRPIQIKNSYMGSCQNCIRAESRNTPMIYSNYSDPNAKWKMVPQNGKCAIKNIATGMYLSRCKNCMGPSRNIAIVGLFRETIDDNTNNDLWIVTRREDRNYTFESASTGELLGICERCANNKGTIGSPAGLFTTSKDNSFVIWSVEVDRNLQNRFFGLF